MKGGLYLVHIYKPAVLIYVRISANSDVLVASEDNL